ncbi:MAG: enoyl-CoA hydratase/isomerase family protein [Usitatibacter sp.]
MEERLTVALGELAAGIRAGVATVTLNRPAALNALSFGMLQGLARWLDAWERDDRVRIVVLRGAGDKAFCAGGDVRALHASHESGTTQHHEFFEVEYALDYRIHTYPKPIVALMDGIVMGGGMGIAQGAALRVVGDRTRMAMPETAIGLFPDVGGSFFLSRLPGKLGVYLGLVGPTIRAADAIYCGLACAYLAPEAIERFPASLEEAAAARDVPSALRALTPSPEPGMLPGGELEPLRPAIERHFAHDSVEGIVASLKGEHDPRHSDWAARTLEALDRRSPTMLKVTLEQLKRGAALPLADCFRMELNLVHGCFEQGDFAEGIRALIVEKDNNRRWNPASLGEVGRADVERFFKPRWSKAEHPLARL